MSTPSCPWLAPFVLSMALAGCGGDDVASGIDGGAVDGGTSDAAGVDGGSDDGGDEDVRVPCGDADGDGDLDAACGGTDCDDADATRYSGATEICDGLAHDEDCNEATFGTLDVDGDGDIDTTCCNVRGDGVRLCGEDCDDRRAATHAGASEVCNGLDDDCDGTVDNGARVDGFVDADHDLHGDPTRPTMACAGAAGFSPVGDDCDDTDALKHGAQSEVCNGLDDDCDGAIDESAGASAWYPDGDGDGFGDPEGTTVMSCTPVPGHRLLATDCDDTDAARNPGMAELCNGRDDDCDGRPSFEIAAGDTEDDDRDGFPDAACAPRATADCDDRDPTVHPGAPEIVDGLDNNCDGATDGTCAMTDWYVDADRDGWGDTALPVVRACDPPAGRVTRGGDCDDASATRNPSEIDFCNGADDDCDGTIDGDAGRYCAVPHALPVCASGACTVGVCERLYDDCVPAAPGCETNLSTSALHCSRCGNVCDGGPRGLPACTSAACSLMCAAGFADCDEVSSTGCEIDIVADAVNCGRCGLRCSARPNANPACAGGTCGVSCLAGFADCNGMLGDGCEVSTASDVANCGACGTPCPVAGDVCVRGACTAPAYPSTGLDGPFAPIASMTLAAGRHDFTIISIPVGVTITTNGDGVLDLRATGTVRIDGRIDVSGGVGGIGQPRVGATGGAGGGGGWTGTTTAGADMSCGASGMGGRGLAGGNGPSGSCGVGGVFGGGSGGGSCRSAGGGGGYAGGGGGGGSGQGGAGAGASYAGVGTGGAGGSGETSGRGGEGGMLGAARVMYEGGDGGPGGAGFGSVGGGGGGGSIGRAAAMDLAVSDATFTPGSGGGGGGGNIACSVEGVGGAGGGGAGGAVRISSPVSIDVRGEVLARGGAGGPMGGGGGSGGAVYLVAPEVRVTGTVSAAGGAGGAADGYRRPGGAGGLGRIRVSVTAERCTLAGAFDPALEAGCAPSPAAGTPGRAYVGDYPF